MKKLLWMLLCVLLVGLASCGKKDPVPDPVTPPAQNDGDQTGGEDDGQSEEEKAKAEMEAMFPDPLFREYVLTNFDTDHDGRISEAEALAVTEINVEDTWDNWKNGKGIASLQGVEYFTNLTELYCKYNQLTALDVSRNTALTYLYCEYNQLTELDISQNPALHTLYCDGNQLTSLDVSQNTNLLTLGCSSNQLTTLDVQNTKLYYLDCSSNQLTEMDLSKTNLGNSSYNDAEKYPYHYPLRCAPMETLKTLYLKTGWSIRNITEDRDRNSDYIPAQTEIVFVD